MIQQVCNVEYKQSWYVCQIFQCTPLRGYKLMTSSCFRPFYTPPCHLDIFWRPPLMMSFIYTEKKKRCIMNRAQLQSILVNTNIGFVQIDLHTPFANLSKYNKLNFVGSQPLCLPIEVTKVYVIIWLLFSISVIKVLSFGRHPPPPLSNDVINL